jgi:hypothetical protein
MTDPEALIEAHKQVEREQRREWPHRVMVAIEGTTLAVAGYEVARLVDFALKTQHDYQFNREVRNCVLHFWERCNRESKRQKESDMENGVGAMTTDALTQQVEFWKNMALGLKDELVKRGDRIATLEADRSEAVRAGRWVPMRHDDPHNDGPVWLDENGRLCWAGANGETQCLVLHGDMAVCLWREGQE